MKFCQSCGQQIEDSVTFCPNCGASQVASAPVDPQPTYAQPNYGQQVVNSTAAEASAKKAMILAIVSAALSELGLPGIILAIIAGKEYNNALSLGATGAKMRVANICRKVGLIVGIVFTVVWTIYTIAMCAAIGSNY